MVNSFISWFPESKQFLPPSPAPPPKCFLMRAKVIGADSSPCLVLSGSHRSMRDKCRNVFSIDWMHPDSSGTYSSSRKRRLCRRLLGGRWLMLFMLRSLEGGRQTRQHVRSRVCHRKEIQLFGSHISKQDSKMNSFLCLTNERSFFHLKYIARQRQGLLKLNTLWGAFMGFKVTEPIHGLGCHSSCLKRCWVGQKRKQT